MTSPTDVRVTMMLCDQAAVATGRFRVSSGAWTHTNSVASPLALPLLMKVPWPMADHVVTFTMRLMGVAGHPVVVGAGTYSHPLRVDGQISVGQPTVARPNSMGPVAPAFTFSGLPPPRERLLWCLEIRGQTRDQWSPAFDVRNEVGTGRNPVPCLRCAPW